MANGKSPFKILGPEIAGLFIAFAVILGVLNYFNILSLSQIYPNLFGFLPQREQTSVGSNNYKDVTVERLPKPQELSTETKTYAVNGFFDRKEGDSFSMILSTDVTTFDFDEKTTFLKVDTSKYPNETTQYSSAEEFFQQIKNGDLLFVTYLSLEQGFRTEQVQYLVQK